MSIVSVKNLRKTFDKAVAVEDISFEITKGEIVGLLGQNGAGKSTTIQILLGLITATSGEVTMFGLNPWKERIKVLSRTNFSSAYVAMPHNLKVRENLEVFARLYGVKDRKNKIDSLMQLFGVQDLAKKMTGALSSGQSTRVNLCKALLNDPELLLLDEPTASLDPDIADKVRQLLQQIQKERGLTVIYTSHNMADVEALCQRILFLHKGRIIASGTPQEIVKNLDAESLEEVFIGIARDQFDPLLLHQPGAGNGGVV
ncbi:MAG: ABC transporter ATP-binding protein [Candidatus Obscuribacter sp.]|jgi:ABC-2 type transport system ATP-binding protein|nr:ABC transporter ATP-binding protein [Candidatus Obscuribacter sp.]MBP6351492.1 ABC transporter ATP-binding protein [Candidatus Obscuribacter sp.]MBP7577399.1 ABC transporter ATP-binding protein [Candidatus Obscuribacter sp.]